MGAERKTVILSRHRLFGSTTTLAARIRNRLYFVIASDVRGSDGAARAQFPLQQIASARFASCSELAARSTPSDVGVELLNPPMSKQKRCLDARFRPVGFQ